MFGMGTGVSRLAMTGKPTMNPHVRRINVSVRRVWTFERKNLIYMSMGKMEYQFLSW